MNIKTYKSILDNGIEANQFVLLFQLYNNEDTSCLVDNLQVKQYMSTLVRKQLIEQGNITLKGIELLAKIGAGEMKYVLPDIGSFSASLHQKLQNKLIELRGSPQVKGKIQGKAYPFLCNEKELQGKLERVCKLYKLNDVSAIENTLLSYIEQCHKANNFFPLLHYYILKRMPDGSDVSNMVTEMGNTKEKIPILEQMDDNYVNI